MFAFIFYILMASTRYFAPTVELITTTGSGTWNKPAGVTSVIVECWGGGGGGGNDTGTPDGGGGGGGQYAKKTITYASGAQSIGYSVAASAAAGSNGNDTTWDTNVVVAKGGTAGTSAGEAGDGYASGSVGDVIHYGGNGTWPLYGEPGHGGGAAGSTAWGSDANPSRAGLTTSEYGGAGGTYTSGLTGGNGSTYGGGGAGGSGGKSGGTGAQGLIRITYTLSVRRIFID